MKNYVLFAALFFFVFSSTAKAQIGGNQEYCRIEANTVKVQKDFIEKLDKVFKGYQATVDSLNLIKDALELVGNFVATKKEEVGAADSINQQALLTDLSKVIFVIDSIANKIQADFNLITQQTSIMIYDYTETEKTLSSAGENTKRISANIKSIKEKQQDINMLKNNIFVLAEMDLYIAKDICEQIKNN